MIKKLQTLVEENVKPRISITEIMILMALGLILCAFVGTVLLRNASSMPGLL